MNPNDQFVALDPWRGVYHAIRNSILAGDYAPGERLVEQQLANRFGTSRGPIRTALHELERNGLVESSDRKGSFVKLLTNEDVDEILSLYLAVLALAVNRAVDRMTAKERAWFQAALDGLPTDLSDGEHLMNVGIEISREIFRLAAHKRVADISESLLIQAQARAYFATPGQEEGWAAYMVSLRALIQAIIDGDADRAVHGGDQWVAAYRTWLDSHPAPGSAHTADH